LPKLEADLSSLERETRLEAVDTDDTRTGKVVQADKDGNCEFNIGIRPGSTFVIYGLPAGASYNIGEVDAVGYITSIHGQSMDQIDHYYDLDFDHKYTDLRTTDNENWHITFVNLQNQNANTGLNFTYAPYILLIATAFMFGTFLRRRRK
jgi:hypothetical protein